MQQHQLLTAVYRLLSVTSGLSADLGDLLASVAITTLPAADIFARFWVIFVEGAGFVFEVGDVSSNIGDLLRKLASSRSGFPWT